MREKKNLETLKTKYQEKNPRNKTPDNKEKTKAIHAHLNLQKLL
jgi:hypothetical protein